MDELCGCGNESDIELVRRGARNGDFLAVRFLNTLVATEVIFTGEENHSS